MRLGLLAIALVFAAPAFAQQGSVKIYREPDHLIAAPPESVTDQKLKDSLVDRLTPEAKKLPPCPPESKTGRLLDGTQCQLPTPDQKQGQPQ